MREHAIKVWRGVSAMMGLTYDLDVYVSAVGHVLNLNGQGVLSGVASLCRADEEDGVFVAGTSSHRVVLQDSAIFEPGHNRPRLALQSEKRTRSCDDQGKHAR